MPFVGECLLARGGETPRGRVRKSCSKPQSEGVGEEAKGLDRRIFLAGLASALGGGLLGQFGGAPSPPEPEPESSSDDPWEDVRAEFAADPKTVHLAGMLIASHPAPVREAIEKHRRGLDENPARYVLENDTKLRLQAVRAAGRYFGTDPACVALTDSTTMGLSVLYRGLSLQDGDEILSTTHDHYSTWYALDSVAVRRGVSLRKISLYDDPASASAEEMAASLLGAIEPNTRVLALTWVHSDSGLKLPLQAIAAGLADLNRTRERPVLLCVDGVHGFGVENEDMKSLGCDFFVAGCHKWLYGPRGTGVIYSARPEGWQGMLPLIPPFGVKNTPGLYHSPGGFHAFEHRWALSEAFAFHQRIGKAKVEARIHELARQLKEGLSKMPRAKLHTPMEDERSAGIVAFEFEGHSAEAVVDRLRAKGIVLTQAPYGLRCIRATPCLMNNPEEIERTLRALHPYGRA